MTIQYSTEKLEIAVDEALANPNGYADYNNHWLIVLDLSTGNFRVEYDGMIGSMGDYDYVVGGYDDIASYVNDWDEGANEGTEKPTVDKDFIFNSLADWVEFAVDSEEYAAAEKDDVLAV